MLKKHHPLFISIHTNHPRELTTEVRDALGRLADAGIPLGNQSVLLRGVNDIVEVQKALVHKLLMCRVRPYYLYQCDLINGSSHLRTPVAEGIAIIEGLRGHTTGYADPAVRHRRPRRRRKNPDQPELRRGYRVREDHAAEFRGRDFRVSGPHADPGSGVGESASASAQPLDLGCGPFRLLSRSRVLSIRRFPKLRR